MTSDSPTQPAVPDDLLAGTPGSDDFDPKELAQFGASTRVLAGALLGAHSPDDARQDIYLSALERPPALKRGLGNWVAGAVKKRILHLRRGEAIRREHESESGTLHRSTSHLEPHAALIRAEQRERLVAAVTGLPDPYRTPIILRYLEEYEASAVAAQLDMPLSTVHTQLHRGLALLRERLKDQDRRTGGNWSDALSILLLPPIGEAFRGRAGATAGGNWWKAPASGRSIALATVGVATLSLAILRPWEAESDPTQPSTAVATGSPVANAGNLHGTKSSEPSTPEAQTSERAAIALETAQPVASAMPTQSIENPALDLRLHVVSASTQAPLPGAIITLGSKDPNVASMWPTTEAPGGDTATDELGTLALASTALTSPWAHIQSPGYIGTWVILEGLTGAATIELAPSGTLIVDGAQAARAWPAASFPIAVPPIDLRPDESAPGTHSFEMKPGPTAVSALVPGEGGATIDAALIVLEEGQASRWLAGDPNEPTLTLRLEQNSMSETAGTWGSALLLGDTGQLAQQGSVAAGAPLVFRSVQPGEHQLDVWIGDTKLARRTIEIPADLASVTHIIDVPSGSLSVDLEGFLEGSPTPTFILSGPNGTDPPMIMTAVRDASARFGALPPGDYEVWSRTPRGLGRTQVTVKTGHHSVTVIDEAGATARLIYDGAPPIDRHEVVLVTESGARLPLTFGLKFGAGRFLPEGDAPDEIDAPTGSLTIALPPGRYELQSAVDGEYRQPQTIRIQPGESIHVGPGDVAAEQTITLERHGRAVSRQMLHFTGRLAGRSPADQRPGPLWSLQALSDQNGQVQARLAPGVWTFELAGGESRTITVTGKESSIRVEFGGE